MAKNLTAQIKLISGQGQIIGSDGQTITIEHHNLNQALDGDLVIIKTKNNQWVVDKVVKRAKRQFTGTVYKKNGKIFIRPDDRKFYSPIEVKQEKHKIKNRDKILVEIKSWPANHLPVGKVIKNFGPGDKWLPQVGAIMANYDLIEDFSPAILKTATKSANSIDWQKEIKNRLDLRTVTTLTIDPQTAKDFDDALSCEMLKNGNFRIGVHIADVSFFVKPQTNLDKEAYRRATSVYLVDRTIPMLPPILSENVASLMPGQDRLAFSAIFEMTPAGKVTAFKLARSVINVNYRFDYDQADSVINQRKDSSSALSLWNLNQLANKLKISRVKAGSVMFEDAEFKVTLDNQNEPQSITKKQRGPSSQLIEEFMLLANRSVAQYVASQKAQTGKVFIYRIHDLPDINKIIELSVWLKTMGYELELKADNKVSSQALNKVLSQSLEKEEGQLVRKATVRAMAKAVYAIKNIGHFGLSFEHYTHFTSPIRRYPDLLVHRLLPFFLNHKPIDKKTVEFVSQAVIHSSDKERQAAEAERDSLKFMQVKYMANHIGETITGLVSGFTRFGFFVADDKTGAEGFVRHTGKTSSDFSLTLESGKKIKLGDQVKVKVIKAEPEFRRIDYELLTNYLA